MGSLHAEAMDLVEGRVGHVLRDKWHVDTLIGVGGMAAVYAATHRNGNRVALKVLHQQLSVDKNIRTRFTREGYVANLINHPGIVRVLDDDVTDEGSVFLVMDLLEGETADARARRFGERLPLEDVLLIADGLLDVIAAAHAAGVIHRDIKPENVFFTNDRQVKVLDFGIARLREGVGAISAVKTAAMMGTPAFMPPEQALGRMNDVDALSDVWAVGATMFNLISGQLVHQAETPNELLVLAATATPRSLAEVAPDVPRALVDIVDRALAVDKSKRWSSARAMQHALRQAAAELLRAPLPSPTSGRIKVISSPGFGGPSGYENTLHENEWNVESAVSGVAVVSAGKPRAPLPDTSTLHGVDAAVKPSGSGKRVLVLAAGASLLVAIAGSIGIGLAMRSETRPTVAASGAAPAVTSTSDKAAAEPVAAPAAVPVPTAADTATAPPAATGDVDLAPASSAAALELDTVPGPTPKARPQRNSDKTKKSWLDRRK